MAKKINNLPVGDNYSGEMADIKAMKKPKKASVKIPKKQTNVHRKSKNPMEAFVKARNKKK